MARIPKLSFSGGEVSPEMWRRVDAQRNATGLKSTLNYIVTPQGPLRKRSGSIQVGPVPSNPGSLLKLIPFTTADGTPYILEFGGFNMRVATPFGYVQWENALPYDTLTRDNPGVFTTTVSDLVVDDMIMLEDDPGLDPKIFFNRWCAVTSVTPIGGGSFSFTLADAGTGQQIDTTSLVVPVPSGVFRRVVRVVTPYALTDVSGLRFSPSSTGLVLTHESYDPQELRFVPGAPPETAWSLVTQVFAPVLPAPAAPGLATGGPGGGSPVAQFYRTTALAPDTLEESLPSPDSNVSIDLTIAGNFVSITPATVPGAIRYNVYKLRNGLYGYIAQTEGGPVTDANVAPDLSKTIPFASNPFVGVGNFPKAVASFEGRRVYAATINKPNAYWLTVSGTETNLNYSIPTRADDSITGRLSGQTPQRIEHVVPAGSLIFLTDKGEWKLAGGQNNILTPSSAFPRQDSAEGSTEVRPILFGSSVLFWSDGGHTLRKMEYKFDNQSYTTDNLSILAAHLTETSIAVGAALTKGNENVVWCPRADGRIIAMTYHPEHEVVAWHQHSIGSPSGVASVRDVAAYELNGINALFMVVQRITGTYLEWVGDDTNFGSGPDIVPCPVDGSLFSLQLDAPGGIYVTGLWHFVGETVTAVIGENKSVPTTVDEFGRAFISDEYETGGDVQFPLVFVGALFVAEIETLPLSWEVEAAGQTFQKNASKVYVHVISTTTMQAGPDANTLREFPPRTDETYNSGPRKKTGFLEITVDGDWQEEATVVVRHPVPGTSTISGLVIDVEAE